MSALPRHTQSVGALALQSPLALASFTPALRCVFANAEFARLAGQDPDRLPGLAWDHIFPRTSLHDTAVLWAVLSGTSTGLPLQLPGVCLRRRRRDDARLDQEWAGLDTLPVQYPATAYLIDVPGAAPLLGVTARRRHRSPWSTDDVGGLWTDTGVAAVGERIDHFLGRWPRGPAWVVLLAAAVESASGQRSFFGPDGVNLLSLAGRLTASFRDDDCLSVLDRQWPVLACPIDRAADAGPLADRFRTTIQQGSGSSSAAPAFEFRMALGQGLPGRAAELLALLDVGAERGPRTGPRLVPVHGA